MIDTDLGNRVRRRRFWAGLALIPAAANIVLVAVLGRAFMGVGPVSSEAGPGARLSPEQLREGLSAARQNLNQGRPQAAQAMLVKLVEMVPENQDARVLFAETLLEAGRPAEALAQYETAIAVGPDSPELRFAAGTVASAAGRPETAEIHYLAAQSGAPGNPQYPLYLGAVQRRLGKTTEAEVSLLRAGKLDPGLAVVWGHLADIALQTNKLSIAATHIKRARDLDPASAVWRLIEARILRRENQPETAARLLMALDERSRLDNPDVLRELGLCFGLLSRPGDAADLYARAAQVRPADPEVLYEAALWHERAGRTALAISYAQKAAGLGNPASAELLRRLQGQAGAP